MERIINITAVTAVDPDGIVFINESGAQEKLLFAECIKNWVDYFNEINSSAGREPLSYEHSRCIGERYMTGKDPYILLFGNTRLKIKMKRRPFARLTEVQKNLPRLLYEVGKVTTFDMT